jgi:hypothetical protein
MIYGTNGFFGYGYYDPADPTAVMWWSHQQRKEEPSTEELCSINSEILRQQLIEQHRGWAEPVPQLLSPIHHRSAEAQADLSIIRARYALVRGRTGLICAAGG